MTCRDETLASVKQILRRTGRNEFTVQEVVEQMQADGTAYKESTIRTHITSEDVR